MEENIDPLSETKSASVSLSRDPSANEEQEQPQPFVDDSASQTIRRKKQPTDGSFNQRTKINTISSVSQSIVDRMQQTNIEDDIQDDSEVAPSKLSFCRKTASVLWRYFRPYFILDHLDWKSLKPVIRTFVQFWVSFVLLEISAVNEWMGSAAYLITAAAVIMASGQMSIIFATIVPLTVMAGVVFSLAIGTVVLAINNRIRGFPSEESIALELIQQGVCKIDISLAECVRNEIFSGRFLNTRATVITIVGYTFGQTVLYLVRIINPIFTPGSVTSSITLLILLFYNNMIPFFEPMLIGVCEVKILSRPLC
jgi:hypothetical protein